MHGAYTLLSHVHAWCGTSLSTGRFIPLPLLIFSVEYPKLILHDRDT